jgi:ubiquinone/menaquinone biosynthesis C-methylase UbiE
VTPAPNSGFEVFDRDAAEHGGYVYTATDRLSCRLATQRSLDAILEAGQFPGRNIVDVGCGDGHYTIRFWDRSRPRALTAVDAAASAIRVADERREGRPIRFAVADAHALPFPDNSFDVALVQSILHHDDRPADIIREAFRVAPVILIHEPNGNSLGLKIIEKTSRYHREHGEKSYSTWQLTRWIEQAGGRVEWRKFAGFVPMFSPDWLARAMKAVEPLVERVPLLRAQACAVVVLVARRA